MYITSIEYLVVSSVWQSYWWFPEAAAEIAAQTGLFDERKTLVHICLWPDDASSRAASLDFSSVVGTSLQIHSICI